MLSNRGVGIKAKKCLYVGVIAPKALYRGEQRHGVCEVLREGKWIFLR